MQQYRAKEKRALREGFGQGLLEVGRTNSKAVTLVADLKQSLHMHHFEKAFPDRFFQVGVAEANMMGLAAGMATAGLCPFTGTFANFSTGRVYDQIRQSIAYSNKNVKICASHMGVTLGEDGATHQMLEDLGLMRMLPNMVVLSPCDYHQTQAAVIAAAAHQGPVYLRFGRPKMPVFTNPETPFEIGKAQRLITGTDITLFATGHMVWNALEAAEQLQEAGIACEVINIATIKPLDEDAIIESIKRTKGAVVAEEHQRFGGLGDSIAQVCSQHYPIPMAFVAIEDTFGCSGLPMELLQKYGLTTEHIVQQAHKVIKRGA